MSTRKDPKPSMLSRIQVQVQDVSRSVLRTFGLALVTHIFGSCKRVRHITGRGLNEPIKIAIRRHYAIAILRGFIHLIPLAVSICEIVLNWNTYYIGISTYNQAVYQLVAKIHEIMIQASLATVLFSYIRHQLTAGYGIPFGALMSGLQINQIAYLWSMEFWATLRSSHGSLRRKASLIALIFACVLLASLSGPSSAVLLIPRSEYWPAGSTDIWINSTLENFYPSRLDETFVSNSCSIAQGDGLSNGCPSSEWEIIRESFAANYRGVSVAVENFEQSYHTWTALGNPILSGKTSRRQQFRAQDLTLDPRVSSAGSTTQMAAVADALADTGNLWLLGLNNVTVQSGRGSPLSHQSDAIHVLSGESSQPFSLGICAPENLTNLDDEKPIAFPLLFDANAPGHANANISSSDGFSIPAILHTDLSRREALQGSENLYNHQVRWVALPQPAFTGSSIGAIITSPLISNISSDANLTRGVFLCNFAAGWGTTTLQTHTSNDGSSSLVSSKIVQYLGENLGFPPRNPNNPEPVTETTGDLFQYSSHYPQRQINLTQGWAQYLNPLVQGMNRTVLDLIMEEYPTLQGYSSAEASHVTAFYIRDVLAALISNGLSRVGFGSSLQGSVKTKTSADGDSWIDGNFWLSGKGNVFKLDSEQSKDWVKLHVDSRLQGYAYNTKTIPPRLAIAVLTLYCIIALAHLLYSSITGISSTCWDSIAEVAALAINSTPTKALRNTCAGIRELHTFQLLTRVIVVPDSVGEGEHLEFLLGEEETENKQISPNRKYGTMPALVDNAASQL